MEIEEATGIERAARLTPSNARGKLTGRHYDASRFLTALRFLRCPPLSPARLPEAVSCHGLVALAPFDGEL